MKKITWKRRGARWSALLLTLFLLVLCVWGGQAAASTARVVVRSHNSRQFAAGKVIVVSLAQQRLYAYENGSQVFSTTVLTGRPELGTPTGTYHVFAKLSPTTFYSPFPPGSVEWYPPTHITYALEWKEGGFFLHDSWWHSVYGPGTNQWHYDPIDGWQSGSHGCISMPLSAAAWLYNWAPIGTTVQINA
ncbi:MAG TPA: L,D-transpeptidase [Ktedonobacteraceae bacterium]